MRTALIAVGISLIPAVASAQSVTREYAEEPTGGLELPATPLAGDHDERAVVANPGGLQLLDGAGMTLALDLSDNDHSASAGTGGGIFIAGPIGGRLLPRLGFGLAIESLRPPHSSLAPDPGTPWRFSVAMSTPFGRRGGLGVALRHFYGEGPADGESVFDVGASLRLTNHLAIGAVVRDLNAPTFGELPVQRRYELEVTARPLTTDRLELGLGGRVGETRGDVDGWGRVSVRPARGIGLLAAAESRSLSILETSPSGLRERDERDLRLTAGIEVSFGALGATLFGRGRIDEDGEGHATGGMLVARWAEAPPPAVQGRAPRIERLELSGTIGARQLIAVVERLRAIRRDRAVKGVVLAIDGATGGWATLQELRDEVAAVSRAGIKVFAYLVSASGRDYWLATAADRIYLDPAGGVRLVGFAGTTLYFRGAFDKLGVAAQFEKIAEFKSAPEQFTEVAPTPPALRMRDELYDSLWRNFVAGIAAGRKLDVATVESLIDRGPYTAGQLEKDHQLVDAVADPDRVTELVARELGGLAPIGLAPVEKDDRWIRPAIAVIYAEGDIVDGSSSTVPFLGRKMVGGETMAAAIRAARENPEVRAIVLRIDSPGGSALASEVMSREVFKTRGVKPIICSMGDMAASGGYFLASGCDLIFAEPMTITGSIGIFYGKFDVSGLLAKLGVTTDTFHRGARADMESMFRPYSSEERTLLRDRLSYFYGRFTAAVSEGRHLSQARVDELGRGRVWSGEQAAKNGLVDRLGGLGDAIGAAKQRVGLRLDEPVRVVSLPKLPGGLLATLLSMADGEARAASPLSVLELPAVRSVLESIPTSVLVAPDSVQARLPYQIVWE